MSGKVGYNEKKELVYKGKRLKGSDIIQLVQHAVDKGDKRQYLKGLRRFYSILKRIGAPNSLVKNKWGRSLAYKKKGARVPGKRNNNNGTLSTVDG